MSVYVDDAETPYGRMKMSHMVADSRRELLEMADRIGLDHRHLQASGTYREHFDVCKSKRAEAVRLGAVEVSPREIVRILQGRSESA